MKKIILLFVVMIFSQIYAKNFIITSPDKKLKVNVNIGEKISYSISKNGIQIISPSFISMKLNAGLILGENPVLVDSKSVSINEKIKPVVKQKFETILNIYNELILDFKNNYTIVFRVYDDGVAYRFKTRFNDTITIYHEQFEANFTGDYKIYFPEEESFMSHSERLYKYINLSEIKSERFCSLPALVDINGKIKCAITEADLEDYHGMYLKGTDNSS